MPDASPIGSTAAVFSSYCFNASKLAAMQQLNGTVRSQRPFARLQQFPLSREPFQGQCSWPVTSLSSPAASSARSAFLLHNLYPVSPVSGCFHASGPLRQISNQLCPLLLWSPLPFGIFTSLRIKAFNQIRSRPARLPNAPDLLSLPAAFYC